MVQLSAAVATTLLGLHLVPTAALAGAPALTPPLPGDQAVLAPLPASSIHDTKAISDALAQHADPVDALIALRPETAAELREPRLLHVFGEPAPRWLTEGDKLRLRRQGKKFMDITHHREFYEAQEEQTASLAGKAHVPKIHLQPLVLPLLKQVSPTKMRHVLTHLTSFHNRYYGDVYGHRSAVWLHDHLASIIHQSPLGTHISLEYFPHTSFPQPSLIARFEPKARGNYSSSRLLTVLGAHQDSANYLFPLLPAPGADDDGSGSVSILEAFRVLAVNGFIPKEGPVEFHWYAAEEGGNLGSQEVARWKRESGANIGAMLEFDATAFIARNATEKIALISTAADGPLTAWLEKLAKEYSALQVGIYKLPPTAGSDYMSFTKAGYPAAFATEGDPTAPGEFRFGEYNRYMHTVNDTIDVNDATGRFSFEHMARFSEFAIAFAVEQAGWDNKWR